MNIELVEERKLETLWGTLEEFAYRYGDDEIVAIGFGTWRTDPRPLVRVHSSCFAAHYLGSVECDCREQLDLACQRMVTLNSGVIVHLDQDGRGNGHVALMRAAVRARQTGETQSAAYAALGYPSDARSFTGAAAVLKHLGLSAIRLLTNNPEKVAAMRAAGIDASRDTILAEGRRRDDLHQYYELKASEGHLFNEAGSTGSASERA